jgi:hypothetical protein
VELSAGAYSMLLKCVNRIREVDIIMSHNKSRREGSHP